MPSKLDVEISKFLSYMLRHAPQEFSLELDREGWTSFEQVKTIVKAKFKTTDAEINRIIEENPKKRFTVTGDQIRAAQGHSVDIDLALVALTPPDILFHGTTFEAWENIRKTGLLPMQRNHVHLSGDITTAEKVATRRKGPHRILIVDTKGMFADGYAFFVADNGVWLTAEVPPAYLRAHIYAP